MCYTPAAKLLLYLSRGISAPGQGVILQQLRWDEVRGSGISASLNAAPWVWFCGFASNLWTSHRLSVDSPCGLVEAAKGWIHTVFSQVELRWLVPSNIFCTFPVYILNLWGRSGQKVGNLPLLTYSEKQHLVGGYSFVRKWAVSPLKEHWNSLKQKLNPKISPSALLQKISVKFPRQGMNMLSFS